MCIEGATAFIRAVSPAWLSHQQIALPYAWKPAVAFSVQYFAVIVIQGRGLAASAVARIARTVCLTLVRGCVALVSSVDYAFVLK